MILQQQQPPPKHPKGILPQSHGKKENFIGIFTSWRVVWFVFTKRDMFFKLVIPFLPAMLLSTSLSMSLQDTLLTMPVSNSTQVLTKEITNSERGKTLGTLSRGQNTSVEERVQFLLFQIKVYL